MKVEEIMAGLSDNGRRELRVFWGYFCWFSFDCLF